MQAASSPETAKGYDSALRQKQDDDLGRWRFAADIAEVIRSTPPEWSARIGIFGKWGEGKSTVLHFLDSMLRSEENIIFTFNPWAVQDLNEMWAEFGTDLIEALGSAGILVEPPWKRLTRSAKEKLGGLKNVAEGAAALAGKDQIAKSTFGLVGNWLKPDGAQVNKIRAKLGEKRIIVFIDDLDRATPELLPKLLLALRELLDLPGFTFVLAFDNEIVANGLKSVNTAWEEGVSFLDKILDFRFYLPKVSEQGKRQLLERMLGQYCSFVPRDSIEPVETLVPDNPRRLKTLIRGMISLKTQVDRHRPDELDWPTIWLAEMVRQESYAFFLRLLEGETLSDLAGIGYQINAHGSRRRGTQDSPDDSDIERLIKEVSGISKNQAGRLRDLIKATRSTAGMNLLYNWKFSFRPEPITWKEFEGVVAAWSSDRRPEVIVEWIAQQAQTTSIDFHRIEQDFFQTLINARQQALSEAASSSSADDHRKHIGKASELLTMITQLLCLPGMLTPERFEILYGQAQYWIGFQMNDDDKVTRQQEKTVLESTIRETPVEAIPGILKDLAPWDPWAFTPDVENTMALKKDLRDDLVKLVLSKMERAVVEALKRSKFSTLVLKEGMHSFAYILVNPKSLPWPEPIRQAMIAIAKGAKSDSFRYEQVNDLLHLFLEIINDRTPSFSSDQVKAILKDQEFTSALWAGATSCAIQFRMLNLFLVYRSALIRAGVAESDLPLPPELRAAAARAQVEAQAGDAAKAQPAAKVSAAGEVDEDLEELEVGPKEEGDLT
jgi:hypothetical protein